MALLLDTHVLLWWLADDPRLGDAARGTIADTRRAVLVSAASTWEIAIKTALGKLTVPGNLLEELKSQGFDELPVELEDGLAAGALPRHHDDPFDRMLIAQASRRDLVVATADARFDAYDVRRLWAGRSRG